MSDNEIAKIAKNKLYIGSGVEKIIDQNVVTKLNEFGQYEPDYSAAAPENIAKIAEVTLNSEKSLNESQISKKIFAKIKNIKSDAILGYFLDLYVGHVVEGNFRKNGSSGGFVSWLAVELMKNGEIDGFIHVKKSQKPGILFDYQISRNLTEIKNGAKSRYYPAELSSSLEEVKNKPGKYAIVGIPEIISEVRLLAEKDTKIKERIKFYFGLVCGHQKTTKYAEAIAWEYGIEPGKLHDIDFRIKRKTGKASEYFMELTGEIEGAEKTFLVRNTDPFVSSWAHGFFKAKFSDFTDNVFNENADITFGDAWLPEYNNDSAGNNILIVRNPEIAKILRRAKKDKKIALNKVEKETIIASQSGLVHHCKDEISYRLFKEKFAKNWAPKKRKNQSENLDQNRKKVQDARQEIAKNSHEIYQIAAQKNDFEYFREKMLPRVNEYRKLYHQPEIARTKINKKYDGAIMTLSGYFNYGNLVQRFALQEFLRQNGYNFVSLISEKFVAKESFWHVAKTAFNRFFAYKKPYIARNFKYSNFFKQAKNRNNMIDFVNRNIEIAEFSENEFYQKYIFGSDQIWREWPSRPHELSRFFGDFLKNKKIAKIAYAASFGNDEISEIMSEDSKKYIAPLVKDFAAISVREKSGKKVLKENWGIENVKNVLDPTLLLTANDYSRLIAKTETRFKSIEPIFTYVLGGDKNVANFIERIQDELDMSATQIGAHTNDDNEMPPVELWLKGFRDAELVITNSFHGMVFAIINRTDFVVIGRKVGGLSRIMDFLGEYDLLDRFVDEENLANFSVKNLKKINWEKVAKKLDSDRKKSGDWLLEQLTNAK